MPEKKYHHGNLRNALLREGRRLIVEKGHEEFSLRKLARLVGVTPMAVYRHFENKEALISAIIDGAFDEFAQSLESSFDHSLPLQEQLLELSVAYVHFFLDNPDVLKVLFLDSHKRDAAIAQKKKDVREELRSTRAYRVLFDISKKIATLHPEFTEEEMVLTVWSRVHGLSVLLVQEKLLFKADEFDDDALKKILNTSL
ncbi:TetR/AcrR family transcriptional regulator [Sediminispirochaeta smaragdinae]|jgi:AcrR family transcriptional regulator|uniref:Transcriptional regulator, TetR family n=1 Tax=Sediminispirochaeta smaragdinae (strain DSM 11293 / JCM 15392 / SEBR 4228) TaxID=573413 RepID=E1R4K9_SEDSS|nr:TetR/AcrR family transcriptional regulator [Sediminispirochaeta smaragdinae]ADK81750.1 transcriptional regulator, TetR family [Sediminispirochaeta smaragdinae DSM 11293]